MDKIVLAFALGALMLLLFVGLPFAMQHDELARERELAKSHFILKNKSLEEEIYQSKRTGRCYLVVWHGGTVEVPVEECQ